jgi:hypothetical protein
VGAAHLGDPRHDENLIVAQLHVAFFKLHNHFIDDGRAFTEAQRLTRWHYQWVIVNDFLPRMVGQDTVKKLLDDDRGRIRYNGKLYQPRNPGRPFMPVEYSGAAYRFGHSMIRAEYEIQDGHTVPIFGQDGHQDLRGSRPIPANIQHVDGLEPLLRRPRHAHPRRPEHGAAHRHQDLAAAVDPSVDRRDSGRRRDHRAGGAEPAAASALACRPARTSPRPWV